MKIVKCDRCKQEIKTEYPVCFGLGNPNEKLEEEESTNSMFNLFSSRPSYKEYKFELCIDCANMLLRWAQHVENELKVSNAKTK